MANPKVSSASLSSPTDSEALDSQTSAELMDRYSRTLLTLHWHNLPKRTRKKLHRLDPLIHHTVRALAESYDPLSQELKAQS